MFISSFIITEMYKKIIFEVLKEQESRDVLPFLMRAFLMMNLRFFPVVMMETGTLKNGQLLQKKALFR